MHTLTKNQITVLKLLRNGKKPSEISTITKMPPSSVHEAIKRGKDKMTKAVETVRFTIENGLLDEDQTSGLKSLLSKT
jgi:transcriptional regulator